MSTDGMRYKLLRRTGLDDQVRAGKILYRDISEFPACRVAQIDDHR